MNNGFSITKLDAEGEAQFMAKGHVPEELFRDEVRRHHAMEVNEVKHLHMRKRPDPTGDRLYMVDEAQPGPGAFKATFAWGA